jgi:hypothetical protein
MNVWIGTATGHPVVDTELSNRFDVIVEKSIETIVDGKRRVTLIETVISDGLSLEPRRVYVYISLPERNCFLGEEVASSSTSPASCNLLAGMDLGGWDRLSCAFKPVEGVPTVYVA